MNIGTPVPAFSLPDQHGDIVSLKDFKGSWLVLYSYPKDNTPGCTTEARDFSCLLDEFRQLDCRIAGVSPDSPASHLKFIDKQELGLRLLSDPERSMLEAYGSWGLKKFMGREFMGVIRSTWLIDPDGPIPVSAAVVAHPTPTSGVRAGRPVIWWVASGVALGLGTGGLLAARATKSAYDTSQSPDLIVPNRIAGISGYSLLAVGGGLGAVAVLRVGR